MKTVASMFACALVISAAQAAQNVRSLRLPQSPPPSAADDSKVVCVAIKSAAASATIANFEFTCERKDGGAAKIYVAMARDLTGVYDPATAQDPLALKARIADLQATANLAHVVTLFAAIKAANPQSTAELWVETEESKYMKSKGKMVATQASLSNY